MRHNRKVKKLNRTSSHRKALMSNMASSLVVHKQIRTTDAKAKELRRYAERLVTYAKTSHLSLNERMCQAGKHLILDLCIID